MSPILYPHPLNSLTFIPFSFHSLQSSPSTPPPLFHLPSPYSPYTPPLHPSSPLPPCIALVCRRELAAAETHGHNYSGHLPNGPPLRRISGIILNTSLGGVPIQVIINAEY